MESEHVATWAPGRLLEPGHWRPGGDRRVPSARIGWPTDVSYGPMPSGRAAMFDGALAGATAPDSRNRVVGPTICSASPRESCGAFATRVVKIVSLDSGRG